jgi:hypothetical protein
LTELELEVRHFWGVAKSAALARRRLAQGVADEAQDELEAIEMYTESGALRKATGRAIAALASRGTERAFSHPGLVVRLPRK